MCVGDFEQLSPIAISNGNWCAPADGSVVNLSGESRLVLEVDGEKYINVEVHTHAIGEHQTVDKHGRRFARGDIEMHIVCIPFAAYESLPDPANFPKEFFANVSAYKRAAFTAKVLTLFFDREVDSSKVNTHAKVLLEAFVDNAADITHSPGFALSLPPKPIYSALSSISPDAVAYTGSLTTAPFSHDTSFIMVKEPLRIPEPFFHKLLATTAYSTPDGYNKQVIFLPSRVTCSDTEVAFTHPSVRVT